ncbi:MAG: gliding motility-associated ABC transporter substrate-binding protein GldG [Daejeonella sp.]
MVNCRRKDFTHLAIFTLILIVLNSLGSFFYTRFDFTAEKRYSLTPITKSILNNLKEEVQITVYLEGDFPSGFKRLHNSTRDLLTDFKSYSNNKLQFTFVNPTAGNSKDHQTAFENLASKGIQPTNLSVKTEDGMSQKIIFPAALITYNGKQMPVNLLQNKSGATPEEVLNNSIQNLEYAFANGIKKITGEGKARIGFTEGHGELDDQQLNDAINSLSDTYEVGRVDLNTIPFAGLDKLKLMVIAKPNTAFTEAEKFKIDYFIMNGGRVFWAIDQVNAELDSLRGKGNQLAFPKKLNLDDMLFKYGIRINYDLIADMNSAQIPISVGNVGGQSQIQLLPWLFYPVIVPNSTHPLVKNLDGIRSEFASSIDTLAVKGVKNTIILASSPFNKKTEIPAMLSLQMVEQEPDPKSFQSNPKIMGVLLEGKFPSDFKNRPIPAGISEVPNHPAQSKATKMIVVADGDILKNQISGTDGSAFPLGYDRFTKQQYGNKNFLLNVADYLTDDSDIIQLRNKEIKLRLLDRARIRDERTQWQMLNIGLPLLLLAIFGLLWQYYRKRKYAR